MVRSLLRLLFMVVLAFAALQLFFLARVAMMAVSNPSSTAFERSEAARLLRQGQFEWSQSWRDYRQVSPSLARAVIASEDAGFLSHPGVDWKAIEGAWNRNAKAEARADAARERAMAQAQRQAARRADSKGAPASSEPPKTIQPKIVGGSTITQQLAKNLFFDGERHLLRKAQELVIALWLEVVLDKRRILEIYLNHVEWGEGVFGAEAAAQHYFRVSALQLSAPQAARLAVMLPAPKRFEKRPDSPYVRQRSATVLARMGAATPP